MATAQGTIRVHEQGETLTFRVEGHATMVQGLPFRRFAEQRLAAGAKALRIDLRACTYMDSTFLGTLLVLKGEAGRQPGGAFAVVEPSPACRRLLEQMGLDMIFPITSEPPGEAHAWADLIATAEDAGSFRHTVSQAHEELARLDGPAGESFRAVLRCLDREGRSGKTP